MAKLQLRFSFEPRTRLSYSATRRGKLQGISKRRCRTSLQCTDPVKQSFPPTERQRKRDPIATFYHREHETYSRVITWCRALLIILLFRFAPSAFRIVWQLASWMLPGRGLCCHHAWISSRFSLRGISFRLVILWRGQSFHSSRVGAFRNC